MSFGRNLLKGSHHKDASNPPLPPTNTSPTPTPTPPSTPSPQPMLASSGIAMVAGGAGAMLLLILAAAVLHMWRRQCRLEDDLKTSTRKLDHHERAAARGFARRMSQKLTESFGRSSSQGAASRSSEQLSPMACNPLAAPMPPYVPGTHGHHGSLVTSSSLNHAIDRAQIEDTMYTASFNTGTSKDSPVAAQDTPTPHGEVRSSPLGLPPHIRRLGSTVFNCRSNGPNFETCDASQQGSYSVNSASTKPESYVSGERDSMNSGGPGPMHAQHPSSHSSQDPYTAGGPVATGPATGRKGSSWSWGQRFSVSRGSTPEHDVNPSEYTMVPVTRDLQSKFRSSFKSVPTEGSNPTSDPSAFHRISQMTREATSSDGGSSGTHTQLYAVQPPRPDFDFKCAAQPQHAKHEVPDQHEQQLQLQLCSVKTAATTSGDGAQSWPSSGSPNLDGLRDSRLPIRSCSGMHTIDINQHTSSSC